MKTAKISKQERKRLRKQRGRLPRDYRLYALFLTDNKYYVGLTAYKDVTRRFNAHLVGKGAGGAKWTTVHKPLSIMEVRELGVSSRRNAEKLETLMTLEYIERFGIENVRGGELCAVNGYFTSVRYSIVKNREKYAQISPVVITHKGMLTLLPGRKQPMRTDAPRRRLSKREHYERRYQRELGVALRGRLGDW